MASTGHQAGWVTARSASSFCANALREHPAVVELSLPIQIGTRLSGTMNWIPPTCFPAPLSSRTSCDTTPAVQRWEHPLE